MKPSSPRMGRVQWTCPKVSGCSSQGWNCIRDQYRLPSLTIWTLSNSSWKTDLSCREETDCDDALKQVSSLRKQPPRAKPKQQSLADCSTHTLHTDTSVVFSLNDIPLYFFWRDLEPSTAKISCKTSPLLLSPAPPVLINALVMSPSIPVGPSFTLPPKFAITDVALVSSFFLYSKDLL